MPSLLETEHSDMTSINRRQRIISLLQDHSPMSIEQFVAEFGVTPTTIRRDLILLEKNSFITRSRGYAHISKYPNILGLTTRKEINQEEKQQIANIAFSFILPNESIIFDSGTTTLALANRLRKEGVVAGLNIITDSIPIAMALGDRYQVILPGGIFDPVTLSLIGPEADAYFHNITADTLFLGAPGVRNSTGLTSSSPFSLSIKKQMIQSSKRVIALIDSTKFETTNLKTFCTFDDIDILITTKTPKNAPILDEIASRGVKLVLTNEGV